MNNIGGFGATNRANGFLYRFRLIFKNLFKKTLTEPLAESGEESVWESNYRDIVRANFTEIFANRLTNYTLCESSVSCDDESINEALQSAVAKWYKWVQMSYGIGRVFLIPYVINESVYTDIIPQSRAWTTHMRGDDIIGIGTLSDVRAKDRERYARITSYLWDAEAKTFTIENKAVRLNGGAEVPLTSIEEWSTIEPFVVIQGCEKPLFAYVDCPKDNRSTDRLQGAPITYGCDQTINEILDCFDQYKEEFKLKETWLGVDRAMLDKNGQPDRSRLYKTFIGKNTESLFEIFSPDIRDQSYKNRILDLFARLEKQVGTSNGILTPAETANATATQVRRSMYDTLALVERMRGSIEDALDALGYIYTVYFGILGVQYNADYTITKTWGNSMVTDEADEFNKLIQGQSVGAVKTEEIRRFIFPSETPEEAEAIVKEIEENKPDPVIPEFFGE